MMDTFKKPLEELKDYSDLVESLKKDSGFFAVSGCIDAEKPHLIYGAGSGMKNRIVVAASEQKAKELCEEYRFFEKEAVYFPAKDILFYQADIHGNLLTQERIRTLKAVSEQTGVTVFTTFDALMNEMAEPKSFTAAVQKFEIGDTVNLQELEKELVEMGYVRGYQVEAAGEFAVRGGILDIYPFTEENPLRMELWGDEVDSLRNFDVESQRMIENLDEITVYPACEFILSGELREKGIQKLRAESKKVQEQFRQEMKTEEAYRVKTATEGFIEELTEGGGSVDADVYLSYFTDRTVSLLSYFEKEDTVVFLDEPQRCVEKGNVTEKEFSESMKQRLEKGYILPGQMKALFTCRQILAELSSRKCVGLASLETKEKDFEIKARFAVSTRSVNPYNSSFELLVKDLKRYKEKGYRVILLSGSRTRAEHLAGDLMEEGLNSYYSDDFSREVKPGEIMTAYGKVKRGYEYPLIKFVVISESDIFGAEKKKKKRRRIYEGEKIQSFSDLSIGDYVVHENHGLGIYRGIEKVEVDKTVKDYIKIEYAKGGNLYILATQLDLIQKYAGSDAKKPKLNQLGTQEWNRTKTKVRGAVKEIAGDLVKLYAARQEKEGFVYSPDTVWQREFEEMFPFEETEDQEFAIEATKKDMESKKIMDRLICGDVGYGKTEVAIRAAFKAVQESKQVVYLVPTTILAQQHYNTFVERMKDFPVRVDLLCRFRTPAEQKKTLEDLKKGLVDIVIGTHRVLSKDVKFKDLGLLIVDEEQRFGVTHKEKIKQLQKNVDVLTLTATPIPRTMHMSLIGIRDMSVLEEAPQDRQPIQTFVCEYNEEMVREAINRELARGGQVYYVYNRVQSIADMANTIQKLVPDANVGFAHGQMKERELEKIMYGFINGEIDVLVSTTIIETGLDISNVNTMIIHDSDQMGLSQLYQLRGRVGRSNRTSYAFLMYRRNKMLKEVAEKRLHAIREFTEMGSGFKIAMRDLEIRGAGNLLGAEQSGHMESVGYDLYCKMLAEAVQEAKGIAPAEAFETTIDLNVSAYIPDSYISNEALKLDTYKRIAAIENKEEYEDMTEELTDRFGEPPKNVQNLLAVAELKALAHCAYVTELKQMGDSVRVTLQQHAKIDVARIPELLQKYRDELKFQMESLAFVYTPRRRNSKEKIDLLEKSHALVEDLLQITQE